MMGFIFESSTLDFGNYLICIIKVLNTILLVAEFRFILMTFFEIIIKRKRKLCSNFNTIV